MNKLVNVPTSLNNLKTKVNDLDVAKLRTVCVDLKKLNDAVDNKVVKNTNFSTLKTEFFLDRIYFKSNDVSQSTFVYQITLDTLELTKDKDTDHVLNWKSNGVYNSKLKPLYTAFLHSIKWE